MKNNEKVPMFIWESNILNTALNRYGIEPQLRQLQEEAAELIVSINHFLRKRSGWETVCEEMSDTKILIDQISLIENNQKTMNVYRKEKLERLERKLNDSARNE